MTKEAIKIVLETVATKAGIEWHSQQAHKMAVGIVAMDLAGLKDQAKRDTFMKAWLDTPASFGCNASAMGQALGRPSAKAKIETAFAGF